MRFGNYDKPKSREEVRSDLNAHLARLHDQRSMGMLVKVIAGIALLPCSLVAFQGHSFLNGASFQSLGYTMFLTGLALSIFSCLVILWGVSFQINMSNEVRKIHGKLAETHRIPKASELS